VALVRFFGDTLTFVVGGLLISVSGYFFHKISSDEVKLRRSDIQSSIKTTSVSSYISILVVGLMLGIGKAILVEFYPSNIGVRFPELGDIGSYLSLGLLAFSAILAFLMSNKVVQIGLEKVIAYSFGVILLGFAFLFFANGLSMTIAGGLIVAIGFSMINISGLPFAIKHLSARHITYGVGVFIGASEVFAGFMEYALH